MNEASKTETAPLLEVSGITKRFPGVLALDNVSLSFGHGEVVALVGENGAGKSTLMKTLAGIHQPDKGRVMVDGNQVTIRSVQDASSHGIILIHQELNLAGNLSIAANIFLGREPRTLGFIDNGAIHAGAKEVLERIGLDLDPNMLVEKLSLGMQQMIEIAKALSCNARLLIMDEPTSSLSNREAEALFKVVKELRAAGTTIVYISHRLGEVYELADRVEVLRDGANAGGLDKEQINHDAMVKMMVGRDLDQFFSRHPHPPGEAVFEVTDLRTPSNPGHKVSFSIGSGEIVGIAGLVGAGRTEVLRCLFGIDQAFAGEIHVRGKIQHLRSPQDAIASGIALIPEDRKAQGIILDQSIRDNIGLPGLKYNAKGWGFANESKIDSDAAEMIDAMRVRTPNAAQPLRNLSGGNQQKIVIGKWLPLKPDVLMLDEPTRGVDIGAKEEIYGLMDQLAGDGRAVLFVSSDMEEILGVSDRVLVMHEGRLAGELTREHLSEEAVMHLAAGGKQELEPAT